MSLKIDEYLSSCGVVSGMLKQQIASETTTAVETQQSDAAAGAGGAGGSGGNSESEEETTRIVVINGVTYLETTTVTNGMTSIQRTVLSDQSAEKGNDDNIEKQTEQKVTDRAH